MQSLTDMYNCTHGPKKDCHACLIPELVEALEQAARGRHYLEEHQIGFGDCYWVPCSEARAILDKATVLYVGPAEAALDQGHPHE